MQDIDATFQRVAQEACFITGTTGSGQYRIMWEEKGPKHTSIKTHGVVMIGAALFYYQTWKEGGWAIYSEIADGRIDATEEAMIKAVKARWEQVAA